jgi:hypothetical protein
MAKKDAALMSRLSKALPRGPQSETTVHHTAPAPASSSPLALKLSVSLYQPDLVRLDEIKSFMQSKGFRNISDSEALRLACRAVVIGDSMMTLYQDMQRDDGRRTRKAS